jgi:hypothetical protein
MTFDWDFYINYYEDLPRNGINNEKLALWHWNTHGKKEKRICNKYMLNKKSIAILFSGQMRTNSLKSYENNDDTIINSITKNFINENFKNKYNYDIFISTDNCDINKIINYFGISNIKNIHLMDINKYLYDINNNIESFDVIYNNYINRDYENCRLHSHTVIQFYRLYDCYNLMLNYKSKDSYDYIIRSRLDIIFEEDINKYLDILDNEDNIHYYGYFDFFGIGRVGIMEYYCNMIKNKYGTYKSYNEYDYYTWRYAPEIQLSECLADYCNINNINHYISIKKLDKEINIYR